MPTFLTMLGLCVLLGASAAVAADAPPRSAAQAGAAPKGVRTVYFIRHGFYEADSTAERKLGPGLNQLGREQAAIVGRYLSKLPVPISSLTSSTLTRARETADVMTLTLRMKVERDSLLSECTPRSESPATNSRDSAAEILACDAQLRAAWARYMRPSPETDTHDVLVAHGNVIRWFVARAVAGDTKKWRTMDIAHGSVTALTVGPDGSVRLVMFSDLNDLPLDKQTWAGRGAGWVKPTVGMK